MKMINSKQQSYSLMNRGIFGNTIGKWDLSPQNYFSSMPDNTGVTVRTNRAGGGFVKYVRYLGSREETLSEIAQQVSEALRLGYTNEEIYMTELMPAEEALLQGEFHELYGCQYNDTDKKHMREIVLNKWLPTRLIIKQAMCPRAYEHFMMLVEMFPMHVIEFSVYNVPVGNLGWNTMIWEVRNY